MQIHLRNDDDNDVTGDDNKNEYMCVPNEECVPLKKGFMCVYCIVKSVYLMIMMGPAHRQIPLNASPQDEEN